MTLAETWIVGCGYMATEYARVLTALEVPFRTICRSSHSASEFQSKTGVHPELCGIENALQDFGPPVSAIVAVDIMNLAPVATTLLRGGTKRILLEKPGALTAADLSELERIRIEVGGAVYVAYNRRFYSSTMAVERIAHDDGGVLSLGFDFTELVAETGTPDEPPDVLRRWIVSNSSHVLDLAFFLAGMPAEWKTWTAGSLDWHPSSAAFAGAGITTRNAIFSYLADWRTPGRWGVWVRTAGHHIELRPLEKVFVSSDGFEKQEVALSDDLDKAFKPGLFQQVAAFLSAADSRLCSLADQIALFAFIADVGDYSQASLGRSERSTP